METSDSSEPILIDLETPTTNIEPDPRGLPSAGQQIATQIALWTRPPLSPSPLSSPPITPDTIFLWNLPPQRFALRSPLFTRIPRFSPFSEEKRGQSKTYPTLADEWEDMLWGNKPTLSEDGDWDGNGNGRVPMGLGLHNSRQKLKAWSRRSTEVGHGQERREEEDVVM